MRIYHKKDSKTMATIDISGLGKAQVFLALYDIAHAPGLGVLDYETDPMSYARGCRHEF